MIPSLRQDFNDSFKQEYYDNLQKEVLAQFGEECAFRISETPVFIDRNLKKEIFEACDAIIDQLWELDFNEIRKKFIPQKLQAPAPLGKPHFLAIDFGLCDDGTGKIGPQLIELQAFPSLFFYQPFLGRTFLKTYPSIPKDGFDFFFSNLDDAAYVETVKEVIIGNEHPENVILMELFPEQQKTRIDFWATKQALGIEVVCITKVIKEGRKLFYLKEGKKTPIHRIYNRVILDELQKFPDLNSDFNLHDDVEVVWVTHPDWFFMISKCIMPLMSHKSIPTSYYLNDFPKDLDLANYVLKPLFSFAGKGINLRPDLETIQKIEDKHNYILQRKVLYAPLIKTNTPKNSKVELRILFVWSEDKNRLQPVINLTRMSKGELINVSHLTEDTWIGSSISFFESK